MRIRYEGELGFGVTAKDLILGTIGQMGVDGAVGHVVEYAGPAIEALSMEGRMTICNMTIEGGGRAGMIAPDDTTFAGSRARPGAPQDLDAPSRRGASCAPTTARASTARSTSTPARCRRRSPGARRPAMVVAGHRRACPSRATDGRRARAGVHGPGPGRRCRTSASTACSSARARTPASATCAPPPRSSRAARSPATWTRWSCPGSQQVKAQAEAEGLDEVFRAAGFDWRDAGCSMCLGMNPDILPPGERCASTSNRNFEGRQGRGGRTHLVSPADGGGRRHRGALRRHQGVE